MIILGTFWAGPRGTSASAPFHNVYPCNSARGYREKPPPPQTHGLSAGLSVGSQNKVPGLAHLF